MHNRFLLPVVGLFLVASVPSAEAAVSWKFDYSGAADFDTSALGLARRASLESAAAMVGALFNHTAEVTIAVSSSNADTTRLASAGSNFPGGFTPGFDSIGFVRSRILTGTGNPAGADGTVDVNFFHNWDLDDDIAPEAFDFKSTMMHELLHAVGFSSDITQGGEDSFGTAAGTAAMFTLFDKFLTNSAGTPIIDRTSFVLDGALWGTVSTGGGTEGSPLPGGIYFSGPRAMAGNGGMPVRIFSPNPWQDGSSGSHLDDLFYEGAVMMKAATNAGPGARTLTAYENGMLEDLGYTLAGTTTGSTALAAWRTQFFGAATLLTGNAEDFDGDGRSNLLEFAQGTNPASAASGPPALEYTGTFAGAGTITKTGQPTLRMQGADTRALFVRRKDFAAAGLTYTARFSTDLSTWQTSSAVPAVLADDGANEIVSVPFPAGAKNFFRIEVTIAP